MLPKILIVDDSKTIRMQVRDMLPKGNFEVHEAKDGVEGFDLINQERPSLVLLDFFMPRLNGWEVLQKIQSQPDLQSIPVVVMTGRKEEVLEKVPGLFRYFACIEKPFEQRTLMEAVRSAMTKAKSRQSMPVPAEAEVHAPEPTHTPGPAHAKTEAQEAPGPDFQMLQTEIQTLKAQVQTLTEANSKLHHELENVKKQMAQIVGFVRQKLG